jgi:hypothetical protein
MNINISDSSQYKQIHYYNLELGQCIGDYSLVYNIPSTESSSDNIAPSRISVIYKGEKIVDSGFIGGISYNYELEKLGLPLVSSSQLNGEIIFNKSITEPTFAKLIIETPFINSNISVTLMCPCDNGSGSDDGSGSDCGNDCQCTLEWDPSGCVDATVYACYVDDGKLPDSVLPDYQTVKISEIIYINGEEFIHDGIKWVGPGTKTLKIADGSTAYLGYFMLEDGTIENTRFFKVRVRYRELYGDFVVNNFSGEPNWCSVLENLGPGDCYNNGDCPGAEVCCDCKCLSEEDYNNYCEKCLDNYSADSVSFAYKNSCREAEVCPSPAACRNVIELSSLNQIPGPDDKCYCVGGGRPIDIDIHCDGTIRPDTAYFSGSTTGFTLWFEPRGLSAVPIIDNILYDTTQLSTTLDIVKVHTTTTAEEMREWVCKNLRFATVIDYNIINSDIDNAIKSNWPYNDLYWEARCTGYPAEDVPINLVPC